MKCPMCGCSLDHAWIHVGGKTLSEHSLKCLLCGYWIPCNRDGKVPDSDE